MEKIYSKIYTKINQVISQITLSLFLLINLINYPAQANNLEEQIDPGIYVFVSFSMNDVALKDYFYEANKHKATLVLRGLIGDKFSKNRFVATKEKLESLAINAEVNPVLYKKLNIKHVPVIVKVDKSGAISKVSGHITLTKALEIIGRGNKKNNRDEK